MRLTTTHLNKELVNVKPKLIRITKESGIPLVGTLMFGCIDRGTNILQVRPTSICNMKCVYCSTSANDSKVHPVNYVVDKDYLLRWIEGIVKVKDCKVEVNLDSVGEVMTYKDIFELIKGIKEIKNVEKISMQTNGTLLNKEKIMKLEGLNQINLSLNTLNKELGKELSGTETYDVGKIVKIAELINKSKIKLLIAPVWIPKVNDNDIEDLVKFSKKLRCKIGIQKYEIHKYGRKVKGVKNLNYWKFYKKLEELEKEYKVKLKLGPSDFGIKKCKSLEKVFEMGEKVVVIIKVDGWFKNQKIGVAKNRCVIVNDCNKSGSAIVKIIENKNNLYMAKLIK